MLDNIFPGGAGIELRRKLRAFNARPPILFYPGAASGSDKQQAIAAGARACLTEPDIDGGRLLLSEV
jgi:CheY-like chemotaxis protein